MKLIPFPAARRGTFHPESKVVLLEDGTVLDAVDLMHWRLGHCTAEEAEALRQAGVSIQPLSDCLSHYGDHAAVQAAIRE